jgi:chaperonin cofactor prefoldin
LVKFDPARPPGVKKTDDPNWDDDLWIIGTAIELEKSEGVDCYIMSKDGFKDYRNEKSKNFIQFEWSWEKIDDRKIDFSWIPEDDVEENETQVLVSPKLDSLTPIDQTIESEYHARVAEISTLEQRLKSSKERLAELSTLVDSKKIEKDYVLPEILLESQKEPFVNPLKDFQEDVQTAVWWVTEYRVDGDERIKSIDIWSSLKRKIIPTFADIDDGSDEYLKDKLGFNANTEIITILEYAVLIYQESSGIELKFSPNQEFLTVIK